MAVQLFHGPAGGEAYSRRDLGTAPNQRKCGESVVTFDAIVACYRQRLYLYALQNLHSHEDAEEAVQDTFLRAYRDFMKQGAKPRLNAQTRAWLLKIILHVVRNRLRKKRLVQVSFDELRHSNSWGAIVEGCPSPDSIVDRNITFDLVERAFRDLPARLLEVARLRFIEGLTPNQIARRFSQPVRTVKSHVFQAKRILREALRPALRAA